eukprot:gene17281-30892_t
MAESDDDAKGGAPLGAVGGGLAQTVDGTAVINDNGEQFVADGHWPGESVDVNDDGIANDNGGPLIAKTFHWPGAAEVDNSDFDYFDRDFGFNSMPAHHLQHQHRFHQHPQWQQQGWGLG